MRDKEVIEEITKIINVRCEAELGQVHTNSKDGKVTKTVDTSLIAKDIYKYLAENAVVLAKEEWANLQGKAWANFFREAELLQLKEELKQTRKETAEKILRDLYHAEYELTIKIAESSKQDVETVAKALALCQNNKIKELAKEHGVDMRVVEE